jgi:acyl-CoA reductase-like NAD-dependent aldehyde dehydrogenase
MAPTATARAYPLLLDGRMVSDRQAVTIRSPYDGATAGETFRATSDDARTALAAAARAFETTRRMATHERQRILREVSAGIAQRADEFARLMALEAGKPLKAAKAEVERAVFTFSVAADEAGRIEGEYLPLDLQASTAGRWGIVKRVALGPVVAISPFNFPLNLVAHKLAPAIAAGCSVVLKPASQTPLCALLLGELIHAAGWPAGALNVLLLSNQDAAVLVEDDRPKLLTFTGSTAVGWDLKRRAGKKRVALELGGNAGVIVHSDADVSYAAERCVAGGFSYAGQSCISVQRIFVQREIEKRFTEELLTRVRALKTGDPLDPATDVGPLIREDDAKRAQQWIEEAVSAGAKLLCGGGRKGAVLEPAVLTATRADMKVNCEEIFAPVVTLDIYDDFGDALGRVNDSRYGLQAGVFTSDARLIFRAFDELEVGGVMAGDVPTFRIDHMPYGGVKDSGMGREGLRYAVEEMTERKLLVMNLR